MADLSDSSHNENNKGPLRADDLEAPPKGESKAVSEHGEIRSRKSSVQVSEKIVVSPPIDQTEVYKRLGELNSKVDNVLRNSGYFAKSAQSNFWQPSHQEESHLRTPTRDNYYKYDHTKLGFDTGLKHSGFIHTESPQKFDQKKLDSIVDGILKRKGVNVYQPSNDLVYSKANNEHLKASYHFTTSVANVGNIVELKYACGDMQNDHDSFIEEITKKNEQYYCGDIQDESHISQ